VGLGPAVEAGTGGAGWDCELEAGPGGDGLGPEPETRIGGAGRGSELEAGPGGEGLGPEPEVGIGGASRDTDVEAGPGGEGLGPELEEAEIGGADTAGTTGRSAVASRRVFKSACRTGSKQTRTLSI